MRYTGLEVESSLLSFSISPWILWLHWKDASDSSTTPADAQDGFSTVISTGGHLPVRAFGDIWLVCYP